METSLDWVVGQSLHKIDRILVGMPDSPSGWNGIEMVKCPF